MSNLGIGKLVIVQKSSNFLERFHSYFLLILAIHSFTYTIEKAVKCYNTTTTKKKRKDYDQQNWTSRKIDKEEEKKKFY